MVRIRPSCGRPPSSSTSTAKTIDASPRGPEPAEKGQGRHARAGPDHGDRDRDHADNRQAEHGVEGDRPGHVSEHRAEEHGAEHDERHGVENLSELLDQMPDLAAASSPEDSEHEASDERGDETGAADRVCNSEGEAGAGHRHDLEPGAADVPVSTRDDDDARGGDARQHPGKDAVADLLEHESSCGPVPDRPGLRLCDGEHDPEQRHADPVVQAALDVQSLSDSAWEPHQRDDRLTERCVRRREDHREEERLGPQELRKDDERKEEARHERQGQADPEQPERHRELAAKRTDVDPRSVREQDESKRRLGEQLDRLSGRGDVDQPQRVRADE